LPDRKVRAALLTPFGAIQQASIFIVLGVNFSRFRAQALREGFNLLSLHTL